MRFISCPPLHMRETRFVHITTDQTDLNLFTYLGSPNNLAAYIIYIDAGVLIKGVNNTWTLRTGTGWHPGSTVTLINNGTIAGVGGDGAAGANCGYTSVICGTPSPGQNGGTAIYLEHDLTIDNTKGKIYGGGGGGGAGGNSIGNYWLVNVAGGGGGGAGGIPGAGGAAGSVYSAVDNSLCGSPSCADGVAGTTTAGGSGGSGGFGDASNCTTPDCSFTANPGGNGGGFGEDGLAGTSGSGATVCDGGASLGGAAGRAVHLNGYTVTWLGGYNATQVKGDVS